MTAAAVEAEPLRVRLHAVDGCIRTGAVAKLRSAGISLVDAAEATPDLVVVAAADTVDRALDACRHGGPRPDEQAVLVMADAFPPAGVLRAVRSGVRAMLRATGTTPTQVRAAVHAARHGDGRLPQEALMRLIGGANDPEPLYAPIRAVSPSPLTPRQVVVLTLMAEGHGNADIARALSCSEHTVKNVIYDLMARLQVRNRAHAVARAVRAGLI